SPGMAVITTIVPRYADIQIFDSLATDQEVFRLAAVNIIDNEVFVVNDFRDFGTVSEVDFTTSAIRFIESGFRYFNSNGIINGLSYNGTSGDMLSFNGGLALINGHITAINAQKVCVPEIVRLPGPIQNL